MPSLSLRSLALFAVSLILPACGGAASLAGKPGEVGKPAPALAIQSLNGKGEISLASLPGKVTVVQFWATWCQGCKKSLSDLEQLKQKSDGSVEVIGIAIDDTPRGVADFAKAQGVTFPIAWDEHRTQAFRWSVDSMKMPSTFIVDAKGNVRHVHEISKGKDEGDLIAREVAVLTTDGAVAARPRVEVESAAPPVAMPQLAVAMTEPPASSGVNTAPPSDTTPIAKPKAKPGASKKGAIVTKKTPTKKKI
jgi:peroxiredoxin